jgi:hypothetical protein
VPVASVSKRKRQTALLLTPTLSGIPRACSAIRASLLLALTTDTDNR